MGPGGYNLIRPNSKYIYIYINFDLQKRCLEKASKWPKWWVLKGDLHMVESVKRGKQSPTKTHPSQSSHSTSAATASSTVSMRISPSVVMVLGLAKCFCFGRGCAPLFRIAVEPPRRFIEFLSTGSHAAEESHHLGDFHGFERNMRENTNSESQKSHVYVFTKKKQ